MGEPIAGFRVLLRGAGEMASGIAHRLHRSGFPVLMTELPEPLAVRRGVCFCEAVWEGTARVEGVCGRRVAGEAEALAAIAAGELPVLVDPELAGLAWWRPAALVDATLAKRNRGVRRGLAPLVVGVGPGFHAGEDVDAVVESQRGHDLGRVLWQGSACPDTGVPAPVAGVGAERVLRAPGAGRLTALRQIGDPVQRGELVARVAEAELRAGTSGVLRGMIRDGTRVEPGVKVGDVDPRGDPAACYRISDKARALGGGVLEALLAHLTGRAGGSG